MKILTQRKIFYVVKVTLAIIGFVGWGIVVDHDTPLWLRLPIGFGIGIMGGSIASEWIKEGKEIWKDRELEGFMDKFKGGKVHAEK